MLLTDSIHPLSTAKLWLLARTSVCTKSRSNEARGLITARKKATSRNGWFRTRCFLLQQQRKHALFLISRPVLETTLASLECLRGFCQSLYKVAPVSPSYLLAYCIPLHNIRFGIH